MKVGIAGAGVQAHRRGSVPLWRSSLYVNSSYLIAANVSNAGFGFVFWTMAARMYPAQTVGLTAAVVSAIGMLAMLSVLGLDYAIIRFLPNAAESEAIINSSLTIGLISAVAFSLVFLAGLGLWSPELLPVRENSLLAIPFIAAAILNAVSTLQAGVYLARKRAGAVLAHAWIFGGTKVILAIALATAISFGAGLLISWVLGLFAAVGCGLIWLLPRVEGRYRMRLVIKREVANDMRHFASANYVVSLLWSAPMLLLPLLVLNMAGPEANAYFYVAASVGGLVAMIPQVVSVSLFAHGSSEERQILQHAFDSSRFTLWLLIPLIAGIFLFGDKILLLFGRAYSEQATQLLWILVLVTLPMTVNVLFFSVRRVQQRMGGVVAAAVWILATTLALTVVLLPRIGLLSVGIAWCVAQTSTAVVVLGRFFLRH